MTLPWQWLGLIDVPTAVRRMERARAGVLDGTASEELFLCEHLPTITLGRSAKSSDVMATPEELSGRGLEIHRVSRGGQVTYHGPGQLMIYPVVRLQGSLVSLLDQIADAIIEVCAGHGVAAEFRRDPAGVWVGDRKIAACGIHLHRRVVTHGFAFNISSPPVAWDAIVACGLPQGSVVSLQQLASSVPPVQDIARQLGPRLAAALLRPTKPKNF